MAGKSAAEIEAGWKQWPRPRANQLFAHYKGGEYRIVATGFIEASLEPCVIYRSLETDTVWVRTAPDFFSEVVYEGKKQPRFKAL